MNFFFSKIKTKSQGVSLVVALGISLFLSGMTIEILRSVEKSLAQSQNLERSNQVFLAAESGLEAAFFHHNARGQGVDFGPIESINDSQKIFQGEVGAEVNWTIEGRRAPIVGVLHEGEKISIPFFWDDSGNISSAPNTDGSAANGFTLTFDRARFNSDGTPSGEELVSNYFDFGNDDGINQPLIAWSLSRVHDLNGIQSLIAISPDATDSCANGTSFLCKDEILSGTANISSFGAVLTGNVVPGFNEEDTLDNFLNEPNASHFRFSFQPLLSFTDTDGTVIEGIPFKLESSTAGKKLPAQTYTATAKVDVADFSKTITVTVPEKQSIGAFDYLVFD